MSYLAEHRRNELLRRVDWRFLLGNPHPAKTLCFAGGMLRHSLAQISDVVISGAGTAAGECDLAVAVDPDAKTLRAAWNALRPGGDLYVEWRSFWKGAASRRLRKAGFHDVTHYWPYPNPASAVPSTWMPLDSAGARHYCLDVDPGLGRLGFFFRRMARTVSARTFAPDSWTLSTTAIRPVAGSDGREHRYGTPALSDAEIQRTLRAGVLETIRRRWAEWDFGTPPDQLAWLLMTPGGHSSNKVVAAVLADANPFPVIAVKMPRAPDYAPLIRREAHNLTELRARRPAVLAPRLLFSETYAGVCAVAESFVPGRPLATQLNRRTLRPLMRRAVEALQAIGVQRMQPPSRDSWRSALEKTIAEFETMFGTVIERRLMDDTRAALLGLTPLPVVFEHRDFSPTNVVMTPSGEIGVLDWESAEPAGVPYLDLIYFATTAAFVCEHAALTRRYVEAYREAWEPASDIGAAVAENVTAYAKATGIAAHDLSALRLLVWLIHARSEHKRMFATAGGAPSAAALGASMFLSLWKQELESRRLDSGAVGSTAS